MDTSTFVVRSCVLNGSVAKYYLGGSNTPSHAAVRHLWLVHIYVHPRMRLEGLYVYGHSNMHMYVSLYLFRSSSCALSVLPRVHPLLGNEPALRERLRMMMISD